MSEFTSPLIVEPVDSKYWKLVEGFEYHIGSYPSEKIIKIPAGFITDFATVPRIFWPIFPPYGKYGKAAVVHDYCYFSGFCKRHRCDKIFLEGMKVLKVKKITRKILYWAVYLFGQKAWNKKRRNEKKKK